MALTTVPASMQDATAQYNGFKNRIINGAMMIDQRNAGASFTPTNDVFATDRFQCMLTQSSKYTVQQSTTAPTGFINSLLVTSSSAYSVPSGDFFGIRHCLEGLNMIDFGWGAAGASTVTLSFWVRSSLTGTFGGSIFNSAGNRSYPFSYTISAANTWEQKTITIAGDTSGTWLTTNGKGLQLVFGLGVGTTYVGTAGAWAGTLYLSATGATSVVGTSGATFYITGVQLEKGSVATAFDYRSYGTELALCQRYYYKATGIPSIGTMPRTTPTQAWASTATSNATISPPVSMRAAPTFGQSGIQLRSPNYGSFSASFTAYNATTDGVNISTSASASLTAGAMYYIAAVSTSDYYELNAEL